LCFFLFGHSTAPAQSIANLALLPTLWSVIALASAAGGGWWWKQNCGGREPSERERSAYEDALELLKALSDEPLALPASWFVVDVPQPDAGVCGNALLLSRGLFECDQLPAVLAHELGHLRSGDGRVTAALNRLVINSPPRPSGGQPAEAVAHEGPVSGVSVIEHRIVLSILGLRAIVSLLCKVIAFAGGGFGLRVCGPVWASYWRGRECRADAYAAGLGQGDELADFLEVHALVHDHPVPFIWLTEHTHPPTELRIERLRAAALGDVRGGVARPSLAELSDPVKGAPTGPPAAGFALP
jgi:Zn-dependent protease with chaperone function